MENSHSQKRDGEGKATEVEKEGTVGEVGRESGLCNGRGADWGKSFNKKGSPQCPGHREIKKRWDWEVDIGLSMLKLVLRNMWVILWGYRRGCSNKGQDYSAKYISSHITVWHKQFRANMVVPSIWLSCSIHLVALPTLACSFYLRSEITVPVIPPQSSQHAGKKQKWIVCSFLLKLWPRSYIHSKT